MATKKQSKTSVAIPAAKQVVPGGWREVAAQSIAAAKAEIDKLPQAGGNILSFRGGRTSLNGNPVQNPTPVVVLTYGGMREWYSKPFQNDVAATPDCYSYDKISPHEKSKVAQGDACETCRWNQWNTGQGGRGKGCKEVSRLVMIHADQAGSVEQIMAAPLFTARPSFTSSQVFRAYVENVFIANNRPVWSAITTIQNEQNENSQYLLSFMPSVLDADEEIMDALAARVAEANRVLLTPYPSMDTPVAQPAATPQRRAKKF